MAKKARPSTTATKDAAAPVTKAAPARKAGGKKAKPASKKAAAKKQRKKKVDRAVLIKDTIAVTDQFQKEVGKLGMYATVLLKGLRKTGFKLPAKSGKALAATARDLRKMARAVKKFARSADK